MEGSDRDFVGREAIEREMSSGSSRWTTTGLAVDVHAYEQVHDEAGILAPRHEVYEETTMSVYRRSETPWDYAGYATSFHYSSLLRRPLALAKIPLDLAVTGTEVDLELTVIRRPQNVLARVHGASFFNPERKTATADEVQSV
jgi:aminomethyltransferase